MKAAIFEKCDKTAWITMNRPETLNSLTEELCAELFEIFSACESDADVRAVVLTGAGRAFCAGGDLKTIAAIATTAEAEEYVRTVGNLHRAIIRSSKPYIAMVNGAAAGAGFNLALACDFICVSDKAKFTQAFSSIGLISDCGGNFLLPRAVGALAAKRLMMLPETLSAVDALSIGIAAFAASEETLRNKTAALAARLAEQPTRAIAEIKKFQNDVVSFEATLRREEKLQAELICARECRESIAAFFAKRKAKG